MDRAEQFVGIDTAEEPKLLIVAPQYVARRDIAHVHAAAARDQNTPYPVAGRNSGPFKHPPLT